MPEKPKRGRGKDAAVSIRSVARKARVSLATVSRVLNDSANVSASVRRRVERAVKSLNFSPNSFARSLRARRSRTLGLLLRDVGNTAFATLWRAAVDVAEQHGYGVVVATSEGSATRERQCIDLMLRQQVDGLVAFVADENDHAFRPIAGRLPIVLVESAADGVAADRVLCANFDGIRQATAFLLQLGHRDVEIYCGTPARTPGRERRRGFEAAFRDIGLAPPAGRIHATSLLGGEDREVLRARLTGAERPSAIIAATSRLTVDILDVVRELRVGIPDGLSFVGFDNRELAALTTPPITTVERNVYSLGEAAMDLLLRRIAEGDTTPLREVTLPASLVIRRSCRAVAPRPTVRGTRASAGAKADKAVH